MKAFPDTDSVGARRFLAIPPPRLVYRRKKKAGFYSGHFDFLFLVLDDLFDKAFEWFKILLDDGPKDVGVDPVVRVPQPIAEVG